MVIAEQVLEAPQLGQSFGPKDIRLTGASVTDYVNSTGDEGFWTHQSRMNQVFGRLVCPPTILDREVGTRLAAMRYQNDYALHAKQSFEFHQPLYQDETYRVLGELTNIYERNEIKYFTISSQVQTTDGTIALTSEYTRAFQFPGARHPKKQSEPLALPVFLEGATPASETFPTAGAAVRGSARSLSQDLMNLYSGPGSNIHTDRSAASRRGHALPIVQGLMALSLECEMLRDVFGERWYTAGRISTRFIRPILAQSVLTPWAVVVQNGAERISLRSGTFNQDGVAVTISEAWVV